MPVMSSPPKLTVLALSGIYPLTTENKVLCRAVGADQPDQLAFAHFQRHVIQRLESAKPALSRLIDSKAMPYLLRVERLPNRPCGR